MLLADFSNVTFSDNNAMLGGAMFCTSKSSVILADKSSALFTRNTAADGGSVFLENYCIVSFQDNITSATFNCNSAMTGGALYCDNSSAISFATNSDVRFIRNMATDEVNLFSEQHCNVSFTGKYALM